MNLFLHFRGRQEKLPDYIQDRKSDRNAASKISSPWLAVTKQKAVPSMEFSRAEGNFERENKWRTPCWICSSYLQKNYK